MKNIAFHCEAVFFKKKRPSPEDKMLFNYKYQNFILNYILDHASGMLVAKKKI